MGTHARRIAFHTAIISPMMKHAAMYPATGEMCDKANGRIVTANVIRALISVFTNSRYRKITKLNLVSRMSIIQRVENVVRFDRREVTLRIVWNIH